MFAVVEIAGRQYKVAPEDRISVPSLREQAGTSVRFDRVLMVSDGKTVTVGRPLVEGARVEGTVLDHGRSPKVVVFKKKRRKGYRVKRGHRQGFTTVHITAIGS
jgi:large subunit ribosomal protein L21